MKRILKIAILCLSCICACWLLPACSSDIEEPGNGGGNGSTVMLKLNAMVPGYETKADESSIPEREQIDNLLIIVINKSNNEVEHNQLHEFPNREGSTYDIEVEKNSTKIVYFLANAESYASDYSYESILNGDLPEKLPYTSKYEIEVKEADINATCYIAIAAVKFDIVFNNNTTNEITVSSLEIGAIANQSYLFPHNKEWDKWVTNITGSNTNKDYFTNYDIPESAEHKNFPVPIPSTSGGDDTQGNVGGDSGNPLFNVSAKNGGTPGSYTIPTFYCHESKFVQQSDEGQHYTIQFEIDGKFFVSEIKTSTGDYLKSLIRSTHVKITVNINNIEQSDVDVVIYGEIAPWEDGPEIEGGLTPIEPQA